MGSDATPEGSADKISARTAKSEKVLVATSAGEIGSFRKQFLDLNYPMLYGFMKNTISQDNLVALQRQLMFTSLPKLKTYLMEEFRRRVNEGLMPATNEPPKPIASPLTAAVTGQTINPGSAEEIALAAQGTPVVVPASDPAKTVISATPEIASTQHTIAVSVDE